MSINRVTLPHDYTRGWGLSQISMTRLGKIVALAGRNGSGKSRILEAVEHAIEQRNARLVNREHFTRSKGQFETLLKEHPDHEQRDQWRRELSQAEEQLRVIGYIGAKDVDEIRPVRFVPKRLNFANPLDATQQVLLNRFQQTKTTNVSSDLADTCLSYIQQCQNRYWNATHPNYQSGEEQRQLSIQEYETLQSLVLPLLGVELTRSLDDVAQIFGKNIFDSKLSDGQRVLLQLAVALHAQKTGLGNSVLLLDELENHLHPSVVIDVLERILDAAPDCQIWLATHSVPLLAHVLSKDPMALWYVDDGSIAHAGRNPRIVLDSLLGGDERISQLHAFTSLPAELATLNYSAESLAPPSVVPFSDNDPQVSQIRRVLARISAGRALRMLDFGAGKGRLLEGLAALETDGSLSKKVEYFALDESLSDSEICKSAIYQQYENSRRRHFQTVDDVLNEVGSSYFDVVVMCNVLHEISPLSWSQLFSKQSALLRTMSDAGYALIVEDMRIPTGEKAHEYGFLVLDTQHLRTLFNVTDADVAAEKFVVDDARGDGRLKAHLISRDVLSRMTSQTRTKAIEELVDTAARRIDALRREPPTYANGVLNGFWTQQFANGSLFLRSA